MPEILTSEIGEKWIQPEIPLVKVMAQEALNKVIAPIPQFQNSPSKTCRDCGNGKNDYYDTHCQILDQFVYSENKACSEFVEKSEKKSCRECHHFDSSIPEKSPYQFCLLTGAYLKYLDGCEKFKPIIPYSPISPSNPPKKRRQWGEGSGNIQMRPYTSKKGKVYQQYYYCYEIRENGRRQCKGSRYIPIAKLDLIREMEADKKPVTLILQELGLIV